MSQESNGIGGVGVGVMGIGRLCLERVGEVLEERGGFVGGSQILIDRRKCKIL